MTIFFIFFYQNHGIISFLNFRYFNSIPLLQTLNSYGIYGCRTIMANRKGFPSQLKNPHLPERGDAEQMQHIYLVSSVWNDTKPVRSFYVVKIYVVINAVCSTILKNVDVYSNDSRRQFILFFI